jgi:hypothetical protein
MMHHRVKASFKPVYLALGLRRGLIQQLGSNQAFGLPLARLDALEITISAT